MMSAPASGRDQGPVGPDRRWRATTRMTDTTAGPAATADADETVPEPEVAAPHPRNRVVSLLTRYWGTTFLVGLVLVIGVSTGALWTNVSEGSDLYGHVAYGLPALHEGRIWTFLTGMFFAPQLVLY